MSRLGTATLSYRSLRRQDRREVADDARYIVRYHFASPEGVPEHNRGYRIQRQCQWPRSPLPGAELGALEALPLLRASIDVKCCQGHARPACEPQPAGEARQHACEQQQATEKAATGHGLSILGGGCL